MTTDSRALLARALNQLRCDFDCFVDSCRIRFPENYEPPRFDESNQPEYEERHALILDIERVLAEQEEP